VELRAVRTFYSDRDGLVTLEDDVLSIVRQVKELYGDTVKISLEPTTGHYVFSEMCADGVERLIFTTPELDPRALDRLREADAQTRGAVDQYDLQEALFDAEAYEREQNHRGALLEHGERVLHGLKKDGVADWAPLRVGFDGRANAH
jgi:hypothetical protein